MPSPQKPRPVHEPGYRWPIDEDLYEVELGYYKGPLERLLAGLQQASLEGAILEVNGFSDELLTFIEERTRDQPGFVEEDRRKERRRPFGRIVFRPKGRRLPIESDTFSVLRDMLERHADVEVADELSVHDAKGCLVFAPDAGDNDIWVSRRLPEHAVEAIRAALGDGLRLPKP
jgi:hypothetical protein